MLAGYCKYLWYVIRHKYYVFIECCKMGIHVRGLLHDLTKFLPSELIPYANHQMNGGFKRSSTGYYKPTDTGEPQVDFAWFLHQKRNPHHWQYWVLPDEGETVKALRIPEEYLKEMLCDWRCTGRAQGTPNTLAWYKANKGKMFIHPESRQWLEEHLGYIEEVST